jgi:3-methyladenine DNA glycosylase AlkD
MKELTDIQEQLFQLRDEKYGEFQRRLMPTVDPSIVIGVRTPALRKLSAQLYKEAQNNSSVSGIPWENMEPAGKFLLELPHRYYEENNLHGFLIERIGDYDRAIAALDKFLPYVDNWATCDSTSPKIFAKHLPELYEKITVWIRSGSTYTVRFAIGMLMRHYLDQNFDPEFPELVAAIDSNEYYINMMRAWYFATAMAKQRETILPYFVQQRLDPWTHNKAIQKCIESYRISAGDKAMLRKLKISKVQYPVHLMCTEY